MMNTWAEAEQILGKFNRYLVLRVSVRVKELRTENFASVVLSEFALKDANITHTTECSIISFAKRK